MSTHMRSGSLVSSRTKAAEAISERKNTPALNQTRRQCRLLLLADASIQAVNGGCIWRSMDPNYKILTVRVFLDLSDGGLLKTAEGTILSSTLWTPTRGAVWIFFANSACLLLAKAAYHYKECTYVVSARYVHREALYRGFTKEKISRP